MGTFTTRDEVIILAAITDSPRHSIETRRPIRDLVEILAKRGIPPVTAIRAVTPIEPKGG